MNSPQLPLAVIVGPTASGKTSLAIKLAKKFGGEIICADSRTVFKDMDVGTAKPTAAERSEVPHWGLDLVEPGESFSAADFKSFASEKIVEIRSRGKIPFLVGGTGLYVDSVIFDYQFGGKADPELRRELEKLTVEQLQAYCRKNNISLPENEKNKRYLIRAIEQKSINTSRKPEPIDSCIIVGITTEKETLRQRIESRIEQFFENGVVDEARLLGKKYGWDNKAMTGNIYRLIHAYIDNEMTFDEMKQKTKTLDWRLAKRQLTWLKRNPHIEWLSLDLADEVLSRRLANEQES